MFYILESDFQLQRLEGLSRFPAYVDVIPSHYGLHPKLATTIGVYIRSVGSKESYVIPIDHPDGMNIDKERVQELLSKFTTLYCPDRKELLYHFCLDNTIDLQLLYSMNKFDKIDVTRNSLNWFYNKHSDLNCINKVIPLPILHKSCEELDEKLRPVIDFDIPEGFDFYNKTGTNVFYLIEQSGLNVYYEPYKELFKPRDIRLNTLDNTVFTNYNLYNATSRPTNAFNSVNFAAIPKSEAHRKCFRPKNDFFVEFDFDGYHLRLLSNEIVYELTAESAHKQLAKLYFGKEEISDDEYARAKQINFHAIYGKIPEEHQNLPIFVKIKEYIDNLWKNFQENGVVNNPQSGKPYTKELKDMNPAKLMNYMMQSLETSNNIAILKKVLSYLQNKKTSIALYTYDAILFDFSKEDGKETLKDIENILNENGKLPVKFKYSKDLVL